MIFTPSQTSSSDDFSGKVPAIQIFPSSSSGKNSRPSNGTTAAVAATTRVNTLSWSKAPAMTINKSATYFAHFNTTAGNFVVKLDAAIQNSRVRRGEVKLTNNRYVAVCGCGAEGCFIHGSF